MGQRFGVCAMLCHIARHKTSGPDRYVLRIASVGEAKAVLSRSTGSLTLAHAPSQVSYLDFKINVHSKFKSVLFFIIQLF